MSFPIFSCACARRLTADEEQRQQPGDHDHQANCPNMIVAQLSDLRHQLAILARRHERQQALNNEDQRQRRQNLSSYCLPSDWLR